MSMIAGAGFRIVFWTGVCGRGASSWFWRHWHVWDSHFFPSHFGIITRRKRTRPLLLLGMALCKTRQGGAGSVGKGRWRPGCLCCCFVVVIYVGFIVCILSGDTQTRFKSNNLTYYVICHKLPSEAITRRPSQWEWNQGIMGSQGDRACGSREADGTPGIEV